MDKHLLEYDEVMVFTERVSKAQRVAIIEIKNLNEKIKSGRGKGIIGRRAKKGSRRDGIDADKG